MVFVPPRLRYQETFSYRSVTNDVSDILEPLILNPKYEDSEALAYSLKVRRPQPGSGGVASCLVRVRFEVKASQFTITTKELLIKASIKADHIQSETEVKQKELSMSRGIAKHSRSS